MQFRPGYDILLNVEGVKRMPVTLTSIKQRLDGRIGQNVMVIAQAGRKKVIKRKGTLTKTYPAVFVVDLDQTENSFERVSYSYSDLLTKAIEIKFDDEAEVVAS